jgi:hypothetical protein
VDSEDGDRSSATAIGCVEPCTGFVFSSPRAFENGATALSRGKPVPKQRSARFEATKIGVEATLPTFRRGRSRMFATLLTVPSGRSVV